MEHPHNLNLAQPAAHCLSGYANFIHSQPVNMPVSLK
jgi:hypothetical protein